MGKIVLLDDLTINQIAAGEVIDRPASVVKEMVENSIDAGAKNITVEIKNGGISLIRITDDGSGIAVDDMEMAFERHATSKIRKAEDLELVKTMGFRGEALASIAAIAKVEMVSKTEEDELGHKIIVEGGTVKERDEIAAQRGTRITVQDLFYNTPVRYKFLKKNYVEAGFIETVVTRLALINKDVAIKLINNDKVLLQTNGKGDFKDIIYSIYGKDVANGILDVDYDYEDMHISGVIGTPEIARSNRSNQMFFVNNRFIKDGKLSAASEQAYRDLLPVGKYAFVILNITMDPKKVDVNVHPAKMEVRFEEDAEVFRAVYNAVKSAVANITIAPKSTLSFSGQEKITENIATNSEQNSENTETAEPKEVEVKEFKDYNDEPEKETEESKKSKIADFLKRFSKDEKEQEKSEEVETKQEQEAIETPVENVVKEVVQAVVPVEEIKEETTPKAEEQPVVANEEILDKEIKIGETKISSNTRELDFDITAALKAATQTLDSTKKIEIQETQVIPTTKETVSQDTQVVDFSKEDLEKTEVSQETQVVELPKEVAPQETQIIETTKDVVNQETQVVDLNSELKEENANSENTDSVEETTSENKEEPTLETTVPSVEAVENITARILAMKMNNMDNTQMIDTGKIREAINETNEVTPEFANMYKKTFGVDANVIRKEREIEEKEREKINVSNEFVNAENDNLFENEEVIPRRINYKLIGTAFDTNVIIELNNEMYIIDQNAALERITYEIIKANYFSAKKDTQNLLLPDIVTVSYREMSIARENVELFENAGFAFEEFGDNTLKLNAVPSFCEDLNTKQLFINVLNEIDRVALNEKEEKEEKFIIAVAKNATKRINKALDIREIDEILQKLLTLENPFDTTHGSITAIKMSRADIEKKFSRRK